MVLRKKVTAFFCAVVCMSILGTGISVLADEQIKQGISIEDIDVSGMSYADAKNAVMKKVSDMQNSTIEVKVGEHTLEATAVDFGLQWNNRNVVDEAMSIGNSGNAIARYKASKDLAQGEKNLKLTFTVNEDSVRSFVENQCKQFEQEPVEASISSNGSGGIDLQPGEDGISINVDESIQKIEDYIANEWTGAQGSSVEVSAKIEKPAADEEDLESITDMLGTYTTYYGSTYGRNANVERGAELINGHLVRPGESFSVCEHLVPFSAENGYELGGAYENGRVVQEYGGGICQVSTTLYNALLLAEIEIVERHNHTMSVSYVPTSMDAAIAEGLMDLVFYNNQETPIFISGYAYGGELTFTVWGKETRPEDRTVYYESETTSTIPAPTTTYLYAAPDQNVGYFNQVQVAAPGSTAALYKYVTYNGETTVEQVNTSTYEATPTSYEVGTNGASDALLTAIYNNDLATAQLAATGVVTIGTTPETAQTDASGQPLQTEAPVQIETTAPDTTVPDTTDAGGGYIDTPDGEVYVGDTSQGSGDTTYVDPNYNGDVVTWE